MGSDDGGDVLKFAQLGFGPRNGGIGGAPVERQHQEALATADEGVAGVVAVRGRPAIGGLIGYPGGTEIIKVGRWAAHVVVQVAVDIVIAGGIAVLNPVVVEYLEDGNRWPWRIRSTFEAVVDDIAQLDREDDVLIVRVVNDPLKGLGQNLGVVAVFVKEILGIRNYGDTEFMAVAGPVAGLGRASSMEFCAVAAVATHSRATHAANRRRNELEHEISLCKNEPAASGIGAAVRACWAWDVST